MARMLLEVLREKLTGLARRLRLLMLRFAHRATREPTGSDSAAAGAQGEPVRTAVEASLFIALALQRAEVCGADVVIIGATQDRGEILRNRGAAAVARRA